MLTAIKILLTNREREVKMKKHLVLFLCLVAIFLPVIAHAAWKGGGLSRLEVTLSPGVLTGDDLPSTTVSGSSVTGESDSGFILTARAAYFFSDRLGIELNIGESSNDFKYRVAGTPLESDSSEFHFDIGPIVQYKVNNYVPFFSLGLGFVNINSGTILISGQKIAGDTSEFALNIGGGLKYYVSKKMGVRVDLRDHIIFTGDDEFWGPGANESLNLFEISGGVFYHF